MRPTVNVSMPLRKEKFPLFTFAILAQIEKFLHQNGKFPEKLVNTKYDW
jgi:hypothetical protein